MKLRQAADGQTLIALLIFMMLALMLALTAVAITIINTQTATSSSLSALAKDDAENAIEDTLLRLERDPSYNGGTLTFGTGSTAGTATITISGNPDYHITAVGSVGDYRRTITVDAVGNPGGLTVTKWIETP